MLPFFSKIFLVVLFVRCETYNCGILNIKSISSSNIICLPTDMSTAVSPKASMVLPSLKATVLVEDQVSKPNNKLKLGLATWGVFGVLSILANAIKRLIPIALQIIEKKGLTPFHWTILGVWTIYMAYTEGYSAFQLKFAPLVVKRALTLSDNMNPLNIILAGPYSMGLFGATRKRMITSWAITGGVFLLVAIVKKLPYPWRSIIDTGVVAGLTYGTISIAWLFIRAVFGVVPNVDPCLPEGKIKK